MKRQLTPIQLAGLLVVIGILFSLISSRVPVAIPNISPLMAIAFIGAMYLPRRWGWAIGPVTLFITSLAYLETNYQVYGAVLSWTLVGSLAVYALVGGLGALIAPHKSLGKIISGSLSCSLLFYVVSNTFSWLTYLTPQFPGGYAPTVAGWWQANTIGVAGYEPTWHFLRNAMAGDLFFAIVLLLILDRSVIFGFAPARTSPQAA
jgi:hypothetical protein